MTTCIQFKFMVEKSIGKGEDSDPILFSTESSAITGVYDGMGGSGASLCTSGYEGQHTKAYVASRIIRDAIDEYISNQGTNIDSEALKRICVERLNQEITNYPSPKSMLKSKLIRNYPTTFTLAVANYKNANIIIDSYWAGDSRNYLWIDGGFYQITKDDLVNDNDPLDNLTSDSALSNCVCADNDFTINHKEIKIDKQPYVILSATDGCFGYCRTPMHFEHLLASSLFSSNNQEDWERRMKEQIQEISGDDFSIAIIAKGFKDFSELKRLLGKKSTQYVEEITVQQQRIEDLHKELNESEAALQRTIELSWNNYKSSYCKYIDDDSSCNDNEETNDIAKKESSPYRKIKKLRFSPFKGKRQRNRKKGNNKKRNKR